MVIRILVLGMLIIVAASGQCPVVDLDLPATVCKGATIIPESDIQNASSFSWDFCDGSIANTPSSVVELVVSGSADPYDLQHVFHDGNHYAFGLNYGSGKIFRFDFGSSVGSIPTMVDLGNLGVLTVPLGIGFWQEGASNFGIIVTETGKLYRLAFGSSYANVPVPTEITGLTGLGDHRQMKIIRENGTVLAMIAGGSTINVTILNFGSSIQNQPTKTTIALSSATGLTSIDILQECGQHYAVVSAYGSGIFIMDFGSSFLNTPSVTQPVGFTSGNMLGISLIKSKDEYFVVVAQQPQGIIRAEFGNTLTNPNPAKVTLGTFNGLNFALGHTVVNEASTYYSVALNNNGTAARLSVLKYPKDCSITGSFEDDDSPQVEYTSAGNYFVTLVAEDANGEFVSTTEMVTINNTDAPLLMMTSAGVCAQHDISFTGSALNGLTLSSIDWDFGDGNSGSGQGAAHAYVSAGTYEVLMQAVASNGCSNIALEDVDVFNEPIADFPLPSNNPLCTNQEFTFTNNTIFDAGSDPAWTWLVNDVQVSTETDLIQAFADVAQQRVKLRASIPGCDNEIEKAINGLLAGPNVAFAFAGKCVQSTTTFTNSTTDAVVGFQWDFGDGQTSTTVNAVHTYTEPGTYEVSLNGDSANGCQNVLKREVIIYAIPEPGFLLDLPPFSCSGTPSQFHDVTPNPDDSNVDVRSWTFGDNSSGIGANPTHTYSAGGTYDVGLSVTTDQGCSAIVTNQVTIHPSPFSNFSIDRACVNQATHLTDLSTTGIKTWGWKIGTANYTIQNPVHVFLFAGQYNTQLTVTATNDCVSTASKVITVPVVPVVNFSVGNACVTQQAVFTDLTSSATDPPVLRTWDFGDTQSATGAIANHSFSETGVFPVRLNIVNQSGCEYVLTKNITINPLPVAAFETSEDDGPPPLTIAFTNNSTGASAYKWTFNDAASATTTTASPSFTFNELGEYVVELEAMSDKGCSALADGRIRVIIPATDLALEDFKLVEAPSGKLKPLLTIRNNSNHAVQSFEVTLDVGTSILYSEQVNEVIERAASKTLVMNTSLDGQGLTTGYICVRVDVANDFLGMNNSNCLTLSESPQLFTPFPNPSDGRVYVQVISPDEREFRVRIVDRVGAVVYDKTLPATAGLNIWELDLTGSTSGLYIIRVESGDVLFTERIILN